MNTQPSVLPTGMKLVGDVRGQEDFVVLGTIEGEVDVDGAVVVEEGAIVRGNVRAKSISIRGVVVGDATAQETIRVEIGGRMVGDLHAPRVNIVKGALFRGHVHMSQEPAVRRMPRVREAVSSLDDAKTIPPMLVDPRDPKTDRAPPRPSRTPTNLIPSKRRDRPDRGPAPPTRPGTLRAATVSDTLVESLAPTHVEPFAVPPHPAPRNVRMRPPRPHMPTLHRTRARRRDGELQ